MKFTNLLILNAVVCLPFGVGFILSPSAMSSLYGITANPATNLVGQFFGVELLAIGLFFWFARFVNDGYVRRAMCLAFMSADAIGVLVGLIGVVFHVFNSWGWSTVLIYLILSAGFAYFQFLAPDKS
jgi:hypothetical protein